MVKWLIPAFVGLALLGCTGGSQTDTTKATTDATPNKTPAASGTFKVALLTPGPVSDAGWCALAYDGLQGIKTDLGAEVNNTETKDATIEESMRSYAQQGYNLIIGHGFEYNDPGVKLSKEFPKTVFVSSSGAGTTPNAGAFRFGLEDGFYEAGFMAGKMSKTGHIAMIGGPEVPDIQSTFDAFKAGALKAKPGIDVIQTYTGKDGDVAAAKEATEAAIAKGADMVIHQANDGAKGVFDACKEHNVYAFGANADQNDDASGMVIASAIIIAKPVFIQLAKDVKAGTYKGEVRTVGMKDGAIKLIINPKLKDKVPADVQKALTDLEANIVAGKEQVPMKQF